MGQYSLDDMKRMMNAIQDHATNLTEWEENFIDSCVQQFRRKGYLSSRQEEIIERIYSEKTPTGSPFGSSKTDRVRNEGRD